MTKVVRFNISYIGGHGDWLDDVPEDWEQMSEAEKEQWATDCFKENMQWSWEEHEEGK